MSITPATTAAAMPLPVRAVLALACGLTLAIVACEVGLLSAGALTAPAAAGAVAALGAVAVFTRARLPDTQRPAGLALGTALAAFALAEFLDAWVWGDMPISPAEGLHLTGYALILLALVLLARSWAVRPPASFWLDGATLALAIATVDAAYFVPAAIEAAQITTLSTVVQVAAPIFGLAGLFFVFILLRLSGSPTSPVLLMMGVSLLALWLGDAARFWSLTNGHAGTTATLSAVLEPCGWLALAIAPWLPDPRTRRLQITSWAVTAIPAGTLLTAVAVLVAGQITPIGPAAVVLAVATTLAVIARTVLTFGDLRALPQAQREARTDELTGLGNRRWFLREAQAHLARTDLHSAAVLLIDLNRFKELNDALGHRAGDLMLSQLGPRLAGVMRGGDLLARLGGDEFAVFCPGADLRAADDIAGRVQHSLDAPFVLDGLEVHVDASIGVALHPDHASDAEELLQRADVAMYEAKSQRTPLEVYDAARDGHTRERLQLVADLRAALDDPAGGGLTLHYQPQVNLTTGVVESVEALVRWNHPQHGILPPAAFLDVAAGSGLMRRLTSVVLRTAVAQLADWRRLDLALPIAVNLSAADIAHASLADEIEQLLTSHAVSPELLNLELTETDVIAHPERALVTLQRLRTLGCSLALDDFGTGHSSLSLLKMLPVDELKIDRSFVSGLRDRDDDAAIVRAAINLGRDFGLRVVAEGVETAGELRELRALRATSAQGYLISRPVPAPELERWLTRRHASAEISP